MNYSRLLTPNIIIVYSLNMDNINRIIRIISCVGTLPHSAIGISTDFKQIFTDRGRTRGNRL